MIVPGCCGFSASARDCGDLSFHRNLSVTRRSPPAAYHPAWIKPVPNVSSTATALGATPRAIRHVRGRSRARPSLLALGLLAPSALFLVLFTYWPVVQVALSSLTVKSFGSAAHLGFGNYARLFSDPHFAQAVINNVVYAAGTIVPSLTLALLFALGLRDTTRFTSILRTLIALPLLIPLVAAAALFIFIFLPGAGLLDYYLAKFGISQTNWLGDPSLALGSIIAITVWKNTGYYMLFFLAGLAGVPQDFLDAAKIDGAGAIARFRHITLPLLMPTLAFVTIIALLNVLTQVDHVIVMTQGGPDDATSLVLFYIYQQAHQNFDTGLASAATVVSVAFLFALSFVSLRTLERGTHYES
jgi:sn-glycerol 3-phosphate transport system permease protein